MTLSQEELSGLVERVRGLKGPDAAVDAELYATIGGAPHTANAGRRTVPLVRKGDPSDWPAYTASVDAALALVERVQPGWFVDHIGADSAGAVGHFETMGWTVMLSAGLSGVQASAPTLPLALTLALLLSLQSQEPTP